MNRKAIIARIHIAKSRAMVCPVCERLTFKSFCDVCGDDQDTVALGEDRYRQLLMAAGGARSCAQLGDQGLVRVMALFDRAGFADEHPHVSAEAEQRRQRARVIWQIGIRAPAVLGDNWKRRVEGFVKKNFDKGTLKYCTADELRKVIGWINRTEKYQTRR